jgi:hypothetical protein
MHIENELVEIAITGEEDYKEVVVEYEEEIPVHEGVQELPLTDAVDTVPAQVKPPCITLILLITLYKYLLSIYVVGILWKPHAYKYISYESY